MKEENTRQRILAVERFNNAESHASLSLFVEKFGLMV